jgi:hypothetical protein
VLLPFFFLLFFVANKAIITSLLLSKNFPSYPLTSLHFVLTPSSELGSLK